MKIKKHYSPKHWEFGIGFYFGHWFENTFLNRLCRKPSCIDVFFGPWTWNFQFGNEIEVIE